MKDLNKEVNAFFRFQNIVSSQYSVLDDVIGEFQEKGLRATVAKAYFYGTVNGKREERKKNK
jgi:hypothetical protein